MDAPRAPAPLPIKLHCLGGHGAPPEVASELLEVRALPASAKAALWTVLGRCLGETIPRSAEEELDRFCAAHGADGGTLARAIKAIRFLVRQAAARDLSAAVLAEDLTAASGGDEEVVKLILSGYEPAKAVIRTEIVRMSFADHGKLLDRVDWRIDHATTSSRGERMQIAAVTLTLSYTEGDRRGRETFSMPREAVAQLRALCDKILAAT